MNDSTTTVEGTEQTVMMKDQSTFQQSPLNVGRKQFRFSSGIRSHFEEQTYATGKKDYLSR